MMRLSLTVTYLSGTCHKLARDVPDCTGLRGSSDVSWAARELPPHAANSISIQLS